MSDPIQPMFFVGRIDVSHDSGMQRVFGAFGDKVAAFNHRNDIAAHMQGIFKVFEGKLCDEPDTNDQA